MRLLAAGLSHRNAPVELREQVAITPEDLPGALRSLRAVPHVREAMILSTCNRVELFAVYGDAAPDLAAFFTARAPLGLPDVRSHLYQHRDAEAVRHLFRVAASLDSMVVGEPQILGQVKEAFSAARAAGATGPELDRVVQTAFSVAKRVRTETAIGSSSVSIASVAVDLALKIFGSLGGKRVLLVGAGKMGELAARHLLKQGAGSITVCNRTLARAERLAATFGGRVLPYGELQARADQSDILITSTGSHEFLFRREDGQRFLQRRRGRPMFFIDIAVPRDVDPEMNRVDGVFLYDIDDLQSVSEANKADRSRKAAGAEQLVEAEVAQLLRRGQGGDAGPARRARPNNPAPGRQAELRRAAGSLEGLTAAQWDAVDALTRRISNKLLHAPLQALRTAAQEGDGEKLSMLKSAYHLPEPPSDPLPAPSGRVTEADEAEAVAVPLRRT